MFRLKEYTVKELPNPEDAARKGLTFIDNVETQWKADKRFPSADGDGDVATYTHTNGSDFWCARVSTHHHLTFTDCLSTLMENHTQNEAEYIEMIESHRSLSLYDDNDIEHVKQKQKEKNENTNSSNNEWTSEVVTYKFPFPLDKRDMPIWFTSVQMPASETSDNDAKESNKNDSSNDKNEKNNHFVSITLPRAFKTQHTKGLYVSVEVVSEMPDGGVKWMMGTCSDAGGLLPQIVQRPALPAAIAADVPLFKKWLVEYKKKNKLPQ